MTGNRVGHCTVDVLKKLQRLGDRGWIGHCTIDVNFNDWSLVAYFSFHLMPVGRGGDSCVTTDQVLLL